MPSHDSKEEHIVHSFVKNSREEVRAVLRFYNGYWLADIRVYVENKNDTTVPTKKGIAVTLEHLPDLERSIEALKSEAANLVATKPSRNGSGQ